jgi:phosphoglycerate dehydrogenase-like enzyme
MSFSLPFRPTRVVVGHHLHADMVALLSARRPDLQVVGAPIPELRAAHFADADAYMGFKQPPGVADLGRVRWVHSTGAGVDGWLRGASLNPDVLVTRSPELFGGQITEWAITRIFALQQDLFRLQAAQQQRVWDQHEIPRVAGTTALFVGTGDIGSTMATALRALGVRCVGVSRSGVSDCPAFDAVHTLSALPALAATAQWIILSLPNTPATYRLVNRTVLSHCRGAVLLNCGRGSVVEEAAIPEALDAGWLRAAILDVFEVEPLPAESPLWGDPRVILSPHMSGLTTVEGAVSGFVECLESLERGELPPWSIDRSRGY